MGNSEQASLTKNAGLVGVSKFVNILGLLAASMILTRLLSRSEYGNYEQVWLVYNSFLPLVGYGLSSSIYFFSARDDRRVVYSAASLGTTIIGIITGILLAVLAPYIAGWFQADVLTDYIRVFALYAVLSSPSLMFESVFVTEGRVGLLLLGNALVAFLFAVVVTLSAFIFHSLTVVFFSIAAVGLAKSAFLFYYLIREGRLSSNGIGRSMKAQMFYALPILVSSLMGTVSKQIDRYLVTILFTPDQFALYAIGSKEIPMIAVITGSASAVLFPVFSELGSKDMRSQFIALWRNSISKTGLFLLPLMVFLLFAAEDFMGFFFGGKYIASAPVFRIFLLNLPLRLAFYSQALLSLGKQKLYMYATIADMILSGAASYVLMKFYGLEGAAVGKVIVTYLDVFFLASVLMILLKTNVKEFFPWIKIFRIVGMAVAALVPVIFLHNVITGVYVRFVVECVLFGISFGLIAIITKSVRVVNLRKLQFTID